MPHWQAVQLVFQVMPSRREQLHQGREAIIMAGLQQVRQLMHHDLFEALWRFFGKVSV